MRLGSQIGGVLSSILDVNASKKHREDANKWMRNAPLNSQRDFQNFVLMAQKNDYVQYPEIQSMISFYQDEMKKQIESEKVAEFMRVYGEDPMRPAGVPVAKMPVQQDPQREMITQGVSLGFMNPEEALKSLMDISAEQKKTDDELKKLEIEEKYGILKEGVKSAVGKGMAVFDAPITDDLINKFMTGAPGGGFKIGKAPPTRHIQQSIGGGAADARKDKKASLAELNNLSSQWIKYQTELRQLYNYHRNRAKPLVSGGMLVKDAPTYNVQEAINNDPQINQIIQRLSTIQTRIQDLQTELYSTPSGATSKSKYEKLNVRRYK